MIGHQLYKVRYRFVERRKLPKGDRYVWHAYVLGDSRVSEVSCAVDWFWSKP